MTAASGAEAEDREREAHGYNASVLLLMGTPYALLGVVGFAVYRGLRKRAATVPMEEPPWAG